MIKRVIFKKSSIYETLFVNMLRLYPRAPHRNQSPLRNKIEGHRSAEILLLGGKFINFAHNH